MKRSRGEERCEFETNPSSDNSSIPVNGLLFSPKKKIMKRCVRFSQSNGNNTTNLFNCDIFDDVEDDSNCKSSLYYTKKELYDIRKSLQKLCYDVRQDFSNYNNSAVSTKTSELISEHQHTNKFDENKSIIRSMLLSINTETRGVEQFICTERRRRRRLANELIIEAASISYTSCHPDRMNLLSSISKRCTTWATTVAIDEGIRDYCRAYDIPIDDIL